MSGLQEKKRDVITLVVQRNNESSRERACEVEIYVRSPVLGNVALLNDAVSLQLLVGEFVRPQDLVFLLLSRFSFGLAAHVVQIRLVRL
jgi:hypothetical protein